MKCPFATFRPVSNAGGPISTIRGLVLHVQEGNGSLFGWFNNPASQVSAHFWAAKDGRLEQYVDTARIAWAQAAGNPNYLSVETEGFVGEPLTAAQIATVGRLLEWAAAEYGFPIVGPVPHGSVGFTAHCNPDGTVDPSWGGHSCPGLIRLDQIPEILNAAEPAPTTREGDQMLTFDPKSGGYWAVRPNGNVYAFNGAPYLGPLPKYLTQWGIGTEAKPITGIAANGTGGFALVADDPSAAEPNLYHITADGAFAK